MQAAIAATDNLDVLAQPVDDVLIEDGRCVGIVTADGAALRAAAVVLTTGTFLDGLVHIGTQRIPAGRHGEAPAVTLSKRLYALAEESGALSLGRMKTGTPARLDGRTINTDILEAQPADAAPAPFSFMTDKITVPQTVCHITHTNQATFDIIEKNVKLSPVYSGQIDGVGPRYCPAIEDKVVRFPDRVAHQIFLEPEGLDDPTVYPNGISTSLPEPIQDAFIRTIPGLENVHIMRPGYAIEYDYVDPRALLPSLELKAMPRLYLADKSTARRAMKRPPPGLVAGMNAARAAAGQEAVIFDRAEAYIGVMIDDLVTKGVSEPYRMFTARAEYRLTLRADHADQRLTAKGRAAGIVGAARGKHFEAKMDKLNAARAQAAQWQMTPNEAGQKGLHIRADGVRRNMVELLAYPSIDWDDLAAIWPGMAGWDADIRFQIETVARYAGYLDSQRADIDSFRRVEALALPVDMDYLALEGMATEVRQNWPPRARDFGSSGAA